MRYFNPIGADSGLRHGIHVREPTDVLGQLVLAAQGRRDAFEITGTDYPPRDAPICMTTSMSGTWPVASNRPSTCIRSPFHRTGLSDLIRICDSRHRDSRTSSAGSFGVV